MGEQGLALVKSFEGLKLQSYPDPATGGAPWTVGYGSTKGVVPNMVITKAEADARLRADLETAEKCVSGCVGVILEQQQFDALCSLVFNIGCGNFRKSTLLRKLNDGLDAGAADQFLVWNRAAGKVMAGLTRRRTAERALFLSDAGPT